MTVDAADVDLFRTTFRALLQDGGEPGGFLGLLGELGWAELADDDPATAVGLLFEEQGHQRAATPALDLAVSRAYGMLLPAGAAVAHPAGDGPPAQRADDGTVAVDAVLLAGSESANVVLAPTHAAVVSLPVSSVEVTPVAGLDPGLGLQRVRGAAPGTVVVAGTWEVGALAARRALAHELLGVAEAILDVAVTHVTDRHQFGRPLAVFQTVKHRLAEVKVAVEGARAALAGAWRSDLPIGGDVGKALAGKAALLAARNGQQVCGAIGFTVEHPLPGLVRRAHVLDALYGSAATVQDRLGTRLVADGSVARLPTPW